MSKYTTEVRFICENAAGYDHSIGYDKVEEVIDKSWKKVFDFSFPIFDENYRSVLCKKIIKHYYTREIGFETIGLWKLKLNMMMNEIMPYYNKLYETELLKFNPLIDADYTKTHKGEDAGSGNETGSHTGTVSDEHEHGGTVGDVGTHTGTVADSGSHGGTVTDAGSKNSTDSIARNEQLSETTWDVYSDTPQGALTNVENNTYLTNARKISHDAETDITQVDTYSETNGNTRTYNETNGNTRTYNETQTNLRSYNESNDTTRTYDEGTNTDRSYSNTNEYVEHIIGKFPGKTYANLIKEFRDMLLNIDVDIIGDLSDLFIKLW